MVPESYPDAASTDGILRLDDGTEMAAWWGEAKLADPICELPVSSPQPLAYRSE